MKTPPGPLGLFEHVLGLDDPSGNWYLFWSGFFADITIFAALAVFLAHHNCQGKRSCWRWARHTYEMDGHTHKVCRHHHPVLQGQRHRYQDFLTHHLGKSE